MIDNCGRWTYEQDTPEDKKCDYDRVADWIISTGYKIKTTIEDIVFNIFAVLDYDYEYDFNIQNCIEFVEGSGGLVEFDWTD